MGKYIDADKLIAEIDRLKERYGSIIPKSITAQNYQEGRLIGYEDALYKITSLQQEQPEAGFEKEYKSYMKSRKDDLSGNAVTVNMKDLARHFWNKGLNARKEE